MTKKTYIGYECLRETFRPAPSSAVRWLDWDDDFALAQSAWPPSCPLTNESWREIRSQGYTFCALVEAQEIQAKAAVWRYSDAAWEVAAIFVSPAMRGRGYGRAVVSFATEAILDAGRVATCSTATDNIAMQRTAEAIGFQRTRLYTMESEEI